MGLGGTRMLRGTDHRDRGIVWHPGRNEGDSGPGNSELGSPSLCIEREIVAVLANHVVEALQVSYQDRDLMKRLLGTQLYEITSQLLEDYLHSQLEVISTRLNEVFHIEAHLVPDNAVHAKLSEHIEQIAAMLGLDWDGKPLPKAAPYPDPDPDPEALKYLKGDLDGSVDLSDSGFAAEPVLPTVSTPELDGELPL